VADLNERIGASGRDQFEQMRLSGRFHLCKTRCKCVFTVGGFIDFADTNDREQNEFSVTVRAVAPP
jgi:hypothetical protein